MKLKINYTMHVIDPYGGVRVLFEIMNRLSERGHEVYLTTFHKKLTFPLKGVHFNSYETIPEKLARLSFGALSVIIRKFTKINYSENYIRTIIRNDVRHIPDCDINVAHDYSAAIANFRSEKGIPFHHMQHFEELIIGNSKYEKKIVEEAMYLSIKRIVNSIWLHNRMKEKYGHDLPIVNPGIDHNVFYPREIEKNSDKLRVVAFGKQTRWKGFPELLKAMEIVMKKRKDVEFIVYGVKKPNYQSKVPYKFLERISDDDLAKLYSSADVFVSASWYESFPLPPIEAMACGAPVVTTRYGTEDYAFHEQNSLVVPPKDPKVLAEAILRLLNDEDLREQFRKEGPKTAKQFTWDRTVDKVEKIFKKAVKGEI